MHLAILISIFTVANATPQLPSYATNGILGKIEQSKSSLQHDSINCIEHNITVPLDWFSTTTTNATMNVRYWIDNSCVQNNNNSISTSSPIFLQMGGEGSARCWPCNAIDYQKVTTVSVEHRMYGESVPSGGLSSANLPYLTTPQNLADTAAIIKTINPNNKRRLINFGGSYSGGTAAWFRTHYPTLTYGAVSSSGVVNAIVDYVQFDASIVNTLSKYTMYPHCLSTVASAMNALDKMSEKELQLIKTDPFMASTTQTDVDFMYMVADAMAMAVQYGHKNQLCTLLNISITASKTPLEAVAAAIPVLYGKAFQQTCFYSTECILNTKRDSSVGVGNKAWRWQKCSLLGYIQSRGTDVEVAARSKLLTLNSQRKQCENMFPENVNDLNELIANNNRFQTTFGSDLPESVGATKIVYLDYSDDPWQTASVVASKPDWEKNDLTYCYTICDGCGHCGSGVPKNVTKCKNVEKAKVLEWLKE